ncbi:polyprenol monophosphomannose synthase [Nanoarchaeota archaeon]
MEVVVVDDNSPDQTWKIVGDISKRNKKVHLLLRKGKRGRGLAGKDGYIYCLKNKADIIIEMDADFSHDPKYVLDMLEKIKDYDLVIGSRMVKGGKESGRGITRKIITKLANMYIKTMLGIKVHDCNSGYRCFRRKVLEKINVHKLKSNGPDIVQEVLFKAHLKNFRISEIPIVFKNRTKGQSKLNMKSLLRGYFVVLHLKINKLLGRI